LENIKRLRKEIDRLDEQILSLLSERVKICRSIGSLKKDHGIPVEDARRESQVYVRVRRRAVELALDPAQAELVYHQITNMCHSVQE